MPSNRSHKPGFSEFVREAILNAQHGICDGCDRPATEVHHKMSNTVTNRKLFPHFLQSFFNGVGLCHDCHEQKSHLWRVSYDWAWQAEGYLKRAWTPYLEGV